MRNSILQMKGMHKMEVMNLKGKPKIPLGQFIEIIKAFGFTKVCGSSKNGQLVIKLVRE